MMGLRWLCLLGLLCLIASYSAVAEDYPSRTITIVVPNPPGGPSDLFARWIGNLMGQRLGQQIIVENVGGASGTIGASRVAQAAPDGYTLLMHNITFAAAPALYKRHTYDPLGDFDPIGLVTETPQAVVTKKAITATNLRELIAYIRANRETINLADAGRGSASYLCNLFFAQAIGASMTAVSYRGMKPALNDLLAGQVDLMCDQVANTAEQIKAGNINAYCVTTRERLAQLPSLPTCDEAGLPHLETSVWVALLGPKGMPQNVVGKLAAALRQALHDPDLAQKLATLSTTIIADGLATPEGARAFIAAEVSKWSGTLNAMRVAPE
ncbi:MAG: tripartite tricarboxylate transporter substrate binding protein BugD [Bradyrhizobium sp.]|uniref:tripartite tricarboxylate transporter substrate-binding protein n=1 Tax=Bradyrhizobium sp. TaxID=376 RepID=UPI001D5B637E|nr:tripartite tricarboxylate transporter substrate-binding protein [Bradyrhizobium sp.]MBV9559074.1 tripartite tricarboxylate transporter substrate binding protein BugD [Bradyrhizobium sp.]